ncbi:MAG: polyprenyl synthetase family protein [Vicinamibacterales bacterium]
MNGLSYADWLIRRRDDVVRIIHDEIDRRACSPAQAPLLRHAVAAYPRFHSRADEVHPYLHVPLLVYAGITGDDEAGLPVAAVGLLVRMGSKLYDDLADGDLGGAWAGHSTYAIVDVATMLGCVLPACMIGGTRTPWVRHQQMQELLGAGVMRMLDGQQRDLAYKQSGSVSAADVEASVVGKSGMGIALVAALAAHAAEASADVTNAYAAFGRALGTVNLLAVDLREMFFDRPCRDLVQGTRTVQIAIALEQMDDAARTEFTALLDEARTSDDAQDRVRRTLRQGRYIMPWLDVLNRHRADASAALAAAAPKEPAASFLRELLSSQTSGV